MKLRVDYEGVDPRSGLNQAIGQWVHHRLESHLTGSGMQEGELVAAKEFTADRGEHLRRYLARDLDQAIDAAPRPGKAARKRLDPSRLEAGALASLAAVLERAGKAMLDLSHRAREPVSCKAGEITSAGTLTCPRCGQQNHLERTGHIPPCPNARARSLPGAIEQLLPPCSMMGYP